MYRATLEAKSRGSIPCHETMKYAVKMVHAKFGSVTQVVWKGLPSTLVLRIWYDSDPANRNSFDPATKAD